MSNTIMVAVENFKSKLASTMQDEIEVVLTRLRRKIFEVLEVEDDLDISVETFAKNTINKIFKTEEVSSAEEEVEKVCKEFKGEKKLKRDPDAPKGAKNAFIFFCSDNREEVKDENPDMKLKEITQRLGKMWKDVDEELKEEYKEKAKQDKERYERELENYIPKEGYKNPKDKKKSKVKSNSPKRGRSAYIFFCKENRENVSKMGLKNTDILKKLGEMWKELDEKKKKKYTKMADDDKDRYEEEMKLYVPSEEEKENKKSKKSSGKNVPSKRSPSAYTLFCKDARIQIKEENPDMKFGEITKKLGELWRNLSEKKKKKYIENASELKEDFLSKKNNDNEEDDEEEDEEEDVEDEEEDVEDEEESLFDSPKPKKKSDKSKK
jgi:hypothetical protein